MSSVDTLQIIDSLGEITRHRDREVIEKSLLKTLSELTQNQEFKLFKVSKRSNDKISLGLLAYSLNGALETSSFHTKHYELDPAIKQLVLKSVQNKSIEQLTDADGKPTHILYPALDQHNEVFALLLQCCNGNIDNDTSHFIHGLLKVYSNYLSLIDDNQRDKLTQLLNRDTMDREITRIILHNKELIAAEAAGLPMKRRTDRLKYWVGVLDIDHFKAVNDNFGHLFGDDVLILVARQMQKDINGPEDLLYRYGGEEFVIILQAINFEQAKKTLDHLRANIAKHDFPQVGRVTVSIGMVQIVDQSGSTEIIGQADQALYYAKAHGRNQVCSYEALLESALIEPAELNKHTEEPEFF